MPRGWQQKHSMIYLQLFGTKPFLKALSPLKKGDHPELHDSEFLDKKETPVRNELATACFSLSWLSL